MALIADAHFVKESTTTSGSMIVGATLTLAGAESGFQSFSNGIGAGNSCIATLRHNTAWMVFYAELTASTTLTVRGLIETSAGGQTAITLSAGTKYIYIAPVPALMRMAATTGRDNAIINPSMQIWQRGTSFPAVANLAYTADRYKIAYSGTVGMTINRSTNVPTVSQAGTKFNYALEVDVSTALTVGASDFVAVIQLIEGYRWANFAQQALVIGFWVMSSKTGTHCVSFANSGLDRSYIATYTVNFANTWEYKSVTVLPSPSAGTWDYTTGTGLVIRWMLACGSTYHSVAGSWLNLNTLATSAQVNVCDSTSNFFRITGVSMQVGYTPSGLLARDYGADLLECQRYFEKSFDGNTAPAQAVGTNAGCAMGIQTVGGSTGTSLVNQRFRQLKRVAPSVTLYNPAAANANIRNVDTSTDWSGSAAANIADSGFDISGTTPSGSVAGQRGLVHWTASAEL